MERITIRVNWRRAWPWLVLVGLSATLHLVGLGGRSFHHDEAIHAHAAFNLISNGIYRYDPTYHGPLLYYLTAATFVIADSDFTARLPIAAAGILLVGVAWCLRRPLGERAAWWTGLLATISPLCLYYGRFLRMDILELVTASAALIACWRAVRGSESAWIWTGVWTGLAFATKENAYVTAVLVGAVAGVMMAALGVRAAWPAAAEWAVERGRGRVVAALRAIGNGVFRCVVPAIFHWLARHRWGVLAAGCTAVIVTVPLYTVGLRYPEDWFFPYKAIAYWWGQHAVERVAGPPWYHLPRLALYEFLPLATALAWAARRRSRMRPLEWALLLFGIASIAMYCYLGEKVPWLGVHQVWAFLPLAGMQMARTFGRRGRWWSRTLAGTGLVATVLATLVANFVIDEISPARRRVEALIYVQTCPEIKEPVAEGYRLAAEGEDPVAAVGGQAGWPLSWYWRTTPTWWSDPSAGMRPPLVLCDPEKEVEVRKRLGPGYVAETLPLRAWWLMASARPSLGDIFRYAFTRVPWGEIGSTDVVVLRRVGEAAVEAYDAGVPETLAEVLGVRSARVMGAGWLVEPRGVDVSPEGLIAVADVGLSSIVVFNREGVVQEYQFPEAFNEPETVAWLPDGVLAVADTWNHRVMLFRGETGSLRALPEPPGGWYGPRAMAVSGDGLVAVSDTGNKRVVLIAAHGGAAQLKILGGEGSGPGELIEPGGVAWIDDRRLLVCDTGNHRIQVFDRRGEFLDEVAMPDAWSDFYSRPQAAVLDADRWLVSDAPSGCLWLVADGVARRIDLTEDGIVPAGVAVRDGMLFVTDLNARLWVFEMDGSG